MFDLKDIEKGLVNDGYHNNGGEWHEGRIRETLGLYADANRRELEEQERWKQQVLIQRLPEFVVAHNAAVVGYDPARGEQIPAKHLPIRAMFDEWVVARVDSLQQEVTEFSARIGVKVVLLPDEECQFVERLWIEKQDAFLQHYLVQNPAIRAVRHDGQKCYWVNAASATMTDFVVNAATPWFTADGRPSKLVPLEYRDALRIGAIQKKLKETS